MYGLIRKVNDDIMNKDLYLYSKLYDELCQISKEILPYYDVDKVKSYSVYIWTKGDNGQNVFDIQADKIVYYADHVIYKDAESIITKIQAKLKEIKQVANY